MADHDPPESLRHPACECGPRSCRPDARHPARGRSSPCRPRRSRASSCARGATRTPSTGTCASTPRCARSSSAPTTSCPRRSGGILLDDPRAKLAGSPAPRLTYIAAFGPGVEHVVGRRIPSDRGFAGRVYSTGRPAQTDHLDADDPMLGTGRPRRRPSARWSRVPIVVGESICGVLQLANRRPGGSYTPRDKELLRIFAAYMSSSIQNALDAIRARAQARIDDLTGLANSRYFHTRLEEEIARADREGTDLAMLFIDLDRFKEVNDRFGHLAGSWTLQKVAQAAGRQRAAGGAGRALRRRRVRRDPAGRRSRARGADRRDAARRRSTRPIFFDPEPENDAHAHAAAAHHGVDRASRRTATTWRRAAASAGARARCCASPTRRCTGPRPAAATASRSPTQKTKRGLAPCPADVCGRNLTSVA